MWGSLVHPEVAVFESVSAVTLVAEAAERPAAPAIVVLVSRGPAAGLRVTARFQVQFQRRQRLVSAPLSAANSSQKKINTHVLFDIYNNKLASK